MFTYQEPVLPEHLRICNRSVAASLLHIVTHIAYSVIDIYRRTFRMCIGDVTMHESIDTLMRSALGIADYLLSLAQECESCNCGIIVFPPILRTGSTSSPTN